MKPTLTKLKQASWIVRLCSQCIVLVLVAFHGASAEVNFGESLDWLASSRPHVALGKLAGIEDEKSPQAVWMNRHIRVRVVERLKGNPPETVEFAWSVPVDTVVWPKKTEYLLFFNAEKQVDYAIDLTSFFSLPAYGHAFTVDFRVLKTKKAVLRIVKGRLKQESGRKGQPVRSVSLRVPEDSEAYKALYSGSSCFLLVPSDL